MTGLLSMVTAFLMTGFFVLLARSRGWERVVLLLLFLQVAAAILILLGQYLVPLLEGLGKDATLTGRVPLWALVDERIGERILFGYGYQAFWTPGNLDVWAIWGQIGWEAPHAHNGYRENLLGLGLVGTVMLVLVVVPTIYRGAILQFRAPNDGWLWFNVLVGMVLMMNLTEAIFMNQNDLFWTMFMSASIATSLRYPEHTKPMRFDDPNFFPSTSSFRREQVV
jgi:exopolysaccharide production protein ExoQ